MNESPREWLEKIVRRETRAIANDFTYQERGALEIMKGMDTYIQALFFALTPKGK